MPVTRFAKMQVRRDSAADWTSNDPTLLAGEIGFEEDTGKGKIGDGVTAWSGLSYTWTASDSPTGKSNLTTQYRIVYVDSAGVVTESATIITNATGDLIVSKDIQTGGFHANISTKTDNYTVTDTDNEYTIEVETGATDKTITLPTAADNQNRILNIVKKDSGAGYVIVDGEGAETINGSATQIITTQYTSITVQSNGTEWRII
jgi:hypothetical protein